MRDGFRCIALQTAVKQQQSDMKVLDKIFVALGLAAFCFCGKPGAQGQTTPTPKLEILSFFVKEYPEADVIIDNEGKTVSVTLAYGITPGMAHIKFTVNDGVTASPASGTEVDLSSPVSVYLSDQDGNASKYVVSTSVSPSPYIRLTLIRNNEYLRRGQIDGKSISFSFPYGADLSSLTFTTDADEGVSFEPDLTTVPVSLASPLKVRATAPDGKTSIDYTLTASIEKQETAVRGIYLPSPSHTSSFLSYEAICKSIALLDELNFNCLFVCAWAATKTAWDSDVLKENTTYSSASAGNMYANYTGGSGDALKDIISEAHKKDIRVILWFEYGFMHAVGSVNMNNPLLAAHPDWIGRRSDGSYAHYNNNDFYLNGYSSEVQDFMLSLMKEALSKYPDVDGIQGDDRLPAMPRNSGYEDATKALYKSEKGSEPPTDPNNSAWVRWRLDRLNSFAARMHSELKAAKPGLIVCFAPNKYPWCMNNLMQEWPVWVKEGNVDLLTVQCYVTATYETDVKTALSYVKSSGGGNILNPAMILKNGDAVMTESMLCDQLQYNREAGTCGESQFWFEGLRTDYVQKVFKSFYTGKAVFPEI